jgi:hypothetical protein
MAGLEKNAPTRRRGDTTNKHITSLTFFWCCGAPNAESM